MIYICERCGGYEPDTSHGPVCPDCAIERHLFDESKLKELLDKSEERKLRIEVSTLGVQLDAWHSAFGTTQLSHALARLEAAESECAAWRAAAHEGRNGCIETDGEREEGT